MTHGCASGWRDSCRSAMVRHSSALNAWRPTGDVEWTSDVTRTVRCYGGSCPDDAHALSCCVSCRAAEFCCVVSFRFSPTVDCDAASARHRCCWSWSSVERFYASLSQGLASCGHILRSLQRHLRLTCWALGCRSRLLVRRRLVVVVEVEVVEVVVEVYPLCLIKNTLMFVATLQQHTLFLPALFVCR